MKHLHYIEYWLDIRKENNDFLWGAGACCYIHDSGARLGEKTDVNIQPLE
ncbi:MAG: hypothetical protein IT238_05540 [Bacteroidia bacterium]|nr:hypothetical protein [Bacteroidia bacterium]MCZ2249715.1 hypothetical protein [Bacteroidia bacterium]